MAPASKLPSTKLHKLRWHDRCQRRLMIVHDSIHVDLYYACIVTTFPSPVSHVLYASSHLVPTILSNHSRLLSHTHILASLASHTVSCNDYINNDTTAEPFDPWYAT